MQKMTIHVAPSAMSHFAPEKPQRGIGTKARLRFLDGTFPLQIKPSTRAGLPTTNEMDVHGGYKAVEAFIADVTKNDPFDAPDTFVPGSYTIAADAKKGWRVLVAKEDGEITLTRVGDAAPAAPAAVVEVAAAVAAEIPAKSDHATIEPADESAGADLEALLDA